MSMTYNDLNLRKKQNNIFRLNLRRLAKQNYTVIHVLQGTIYLRRQNWVYIPMKATSPGITIFQYLSNSNKNKETVFSKSLSQFLSEYTSFTLYKTIFSLGLPQFSHTIISDIMYIS